MRPPKREYWWRVGLSYEKVMLVENSEMKAKFETLFSSACSPPFSECCLQCGFFMVRTDTTKAFKYKYTINVTLPSPNV